MTDDDDPVVPMVLKEAIAELKRDKLTIEELCERLKADRRASALADDRIAARIVADLLRRQRERAVAST